MNRISVRLALLLLLSCIGVTLLTIFESAQNGSPVHATLALHLFQTGEVKAVVMDLDRKTNVNVAEFCLNRTQPSPNKFCIMNLGNGGFLMIFSGLTYERRYLLYPNNNWERDIWDLTPFRPKDIMAIDSIDAES